MTGKTTCPVCRRVTKQPGRDDHRIVPCELHAGPRGSEPVSLGFLERMRERDYERFERRDAVRRFCMDEWEEWE